jgi:ABC-2 type transport system permease protein
MTTAIKTGLRATVRREWSRIVARPVYLLFSLILPLAVFIYMWVLFFSGTPRSLPVIVCDQDGSALSQRFVRMLETTASIRIAGRVDNIEAGKKLLLRREGYGLIVVPQNLERDALRGRSAKIVCYCNMQVLTPGSMITQDFHKTVDALAADLAQTNKSLGIRYEGGEAIALDAHTLFNPVLNYRYFLASALLPTMLQIFIVMLSAFSSGIELRQCTAREWLDTAGGSAAKAVAGKMLPYTVLFFITSMAMLAVTFAALETPLRGNLVFLGAATAVMIVVYQLLGFLFTAVTSNLRLALSFAAFYSVPAFAFTGINFPVEAMSFFGKLWSAVLPLTYYGQILIDQTVRGASVAVSLPPAALLVLFLLVLPLPVTLRLKTLMRDERRWGRP